MKKFNLACCLLLFCIATQAQKHEPVNSQKDKLEFEGYTIRLLPAMGGTYGYDIFKENEIVVHQSLNPFTLSPVGLRSKEDAYKVAQWQIEQLKSKQGGAAEKNVVSGSSYKLPPALAQRLQVQGNGEAVYNQRLSRNVAAQLQIPITH